MKHFSYTHLILFYDVHTTTSIRILFCLGSQCKKRERVYVNVCMCILKGLYPFWYKQKRSDLWSPSPLPPPFFFRSWFCWVDRVAILLWGDVFIYKSSLIGFPLEPILFFPFPSLVSLSFFFFSFIDVHTHTHLPSAIYCIHSLIPYRQESNVLAILYHNHVWKDWRSATTPPPADQRQHHVAYGWRALW